MKRHAGGVRKCLCKDCHHNQNNSQCRLLTFPQNNVVAENWLQRSGVHHLTPKRLKRHHLLCSCHFPGGRDGGPEDFERFYEDEVDDLRSPAAKRMLHEEVGNIFVLAIVPINSEENMRCGVPDRSEGSGGAPDATPRSKSAAEALLALNPHEKSLSGGSISSSRLVGPAHQSTPVHTGSVKAKKTACPSFSPRRHLWRLQSEVHKDSPRKAMHKMLDFSNVAAFPSGGRQPSRSSDGDLGVSPLDSDFCAFTSPFLNGNSVTVPSGVSVPGSPSHGCTPQSSSSENSGTETA